MLLIYAGITILIIIAIPYIWEKIKDKNDESKIQEKINFIQTINKNVEVSSSSLDNYIENLKGKRLLQIDGKNGQYIEINDRYIHSDHNSKTIWFSEITNVSAVKGYDIKGMNVCLKLEISVKSKMCSVGGIQPEDDKVEISFDSRCLGSAERLYRIILDIIALNKKKEERFNNEVLTAKNEISSYDKKIDKLEQKKDIINGFIEKYKVDIFALIEDLGANVFRFDSNLYSLIEGNKLFDFYKAKDKFPYYCWNGADETIKEILFFLNSLKKRLQNDWDSKETLDTVVYIVFRNSIVEYFSQYFKSNYSNSDFSNRLFELSDKELIIYKMAFVCNYVVENDIATPLYTTYLDLSKEINQTLNNIKQERKEAKMFRNSEKGAIQKDTTTEIPNENIDTEIAVTETKPLEVIDDIDQLTGEEFEKYIGDYFRSIGYKVIVTPLSGDYGVDIIIENELVKIGVQAKRYTNTVGNSAIQEVVAGMKHYNLDKGMVITNNYFSRSAIALAKDNNIVLWDRDTIKVKFSKK